MDRLFQDLKLAIRTLRRSAGFALVAVITLALGIGANTAAFSVIDAVLLRPLPYPRSDSLVQIYETDTSRGITHGPVSPYNFADWERQDGAFEHMAAYEYESFSYLAGNTAERMSGVLVTANFFRVLGIAPALGRDFELDEDSPGKPHTAILSYGAWQRRFGGRGDIVGQSMTINSEPYTIVGIMPVEFTPFPDRGTEIWAVPGYVLANVNRGHHGLFAVARLRQGVRLQQAQAQMDTIAQRLAKEYPGTNSASGVRLVRLLDEMVGSARAMVILLAVSVGIVLLITCANLASLLLGRVMSRQREIAIRVALGAGRLRLARQTLTESLVVAGIGGTLGVLLAYWTLPALIAAFGSFIPRSQTVSVNSPVLLFSALISVLCGVAFGMAPFLPALRSICIVLRATAHRVPRAGQDASPYGARW